MSDDLERFVTAQEKVYEHALAEIKVGEKKSHWMWFVFPQLAGLGRTSISIHYSLHGLDEARAYLAHPVLGPRLMECFEAVLSVKGRSAREIFSTPDDLKLRSSATLFSLISPANSIFHRVLERYYNGEPDPATLKLLDNET